ncbi:hypothetical protein NKR19_g5245 [Coniochaeta hoffmannii]|uniref:Uncharacterized protein n=1 Tax=Coniochaeta hoffmannii TaxID=91930 RepID=A0AA38RYS7_9PEZI|nr:hypothetical protein NKR19_g5245 [Coniochaeta hoffmannii]
MSGAGKSTETEGSTSTSEMSGGNVVKRALEDKGKEVDRCASTAPTADKNRLVASKPPTPFAEQQEEGQDDATANWLAIKRELDAEREEMNLLAAAASGSHDSIPSDTTPGTAPVDKTPISLAAVKIKLHSVKLGDTALWTTAATSSDDGASPRVTMPPLPSQGQRRTVRSTTPLLSGG